MAAGFLGLTFLIWRAGQKEVAAERGRAGMWRELHDARLDDLARARAAHLDEIRRVEADLEWSRVLHATHIAPEMKPQILAEHRAKVLEFRGGPR